MNTAYQPTGAHSNHMYPPPPQGQHQPNQSLAHVPAMPFPGQPGVEPPRGHEEVPATISRNDESGRQYRLDVVQQPQRARMCGFGDKDRRPITPPPCVRLVVLDAKSGKAVDVNEIDHSMYVLNVDLWNESGTAEVNLVRHTSTTPSISSTTPTSFSMMQTQTEYAKEYAKTTGIPIDSLPPGVPFQATSPISPYGPPGYQGQYSPSNGYGAQYYPQDYGTVQSLPSQGMYGRGYAPDALGRIGSAHTPSGMFTRNLIGSLAASANRLTDPENVIGIWFVLQDLSVRTEGTFRLRFSFVNVGSTAFNKPDQTGAGVNRSRAPVLAACFSQPFTVYSAKKFPGVCESTVVSKCFAGQGIKIPIRKEGNHGKGRDDDDDSDGDQ